jgi:hypothetical protein
VKTGFTDGGVHRYSAEIFAKKYLLHLQNRFYRAKHEQASENNDYPSGQNNWSKMRHGKSSFVREIIGME